MRKIVILCFCLAAGACSQNDERLQVEYGAAVQRDVAAYGGSNAAAAYQEKLKYIERVKELEAQGAKLPAKEIFIWEYARLGLLAEHLGKKDEAAKYLNIASENAKKAYPKDPENKTSAEALHSAIDRMDTPEKFPWRKK